MTIAFTLTLKAVLTFVSNTHDNHKAIVFISKVSKLIIFKSKYFGIYDYFG